MEIRPEIMELADAYQTMDVQLYKLGEQLDTLLSDLPCYGDDCTCDDPEIAVYFQYEDCVEHYLEVRRCLRCGGNDEDRG